MSNYSFVFENNDGVATIRLNERLNALTFQTYADAPLFSIRKS